MGDSVLVKNQVLGSTNGICVVSGGTRVCTIDLSINDDTFEDIVIFVNRGTIYANDIF